MPLTDKEKRVLQWYEEGLAIDQIARLIRGGRGTVRQIVQAYAPPRCTPHFQDYQLSRSLGIEPMPVQVHIAEYEYPVIVTLSRIKALEAMSV